MDAELKALTDSLKGLPESISALGSRIEAAEKKIAEIVAPPAPAYKAPIDDRSPAEKKHDGELSFAAYLRALACKALGFQFEDAAEFARGVSEKDYRDTCFSLENLPKSKKMARVSPAEKTALSTSVGYGGYFAPEMWLQDQWVDILRPNVVTLNAGITRLSGLGNADVKIPKISAGTTAYWIAEGAAITEAELTDTQISFSPKEAACFSAASNQIVKMSNPAIQSMVAYDMAQKMGALIDLGVLEGDGTSNSITGIKTRVTTSSVSTSGAMTWAYLEEFLYKLALQNAPGTKRCWFMHPRTFSAIRQLTTSTYPQFVGTPLNEALGADLAGRALLGYPVYLSTQMTITGSPGTAAVVLFGVPEEVILADWGPAEFAASAEAGNAFQYNSIYFRAVQLVDCNVKHETSWVKCTDTTS